MEVTVVNEFVKGDRIFRQMSDGTLTVSLVNPNGSLYGDYILLKGEVTEEELAKTKELLVDQMCDVIRKAAKEKEEFFIIKEVDGGTSVGWKFHLPHVNV